MEITLSLSSILVRPVSWKYGWSRRIPVRLRAPPSRVEAGSRVIAATEKEAIMDPVLLILIIVTLAVWFMAWKGIKN
jgi:hypothetical protein